MYLFTDCLQSLAPSMRKRINLATIYDNQRGASRIFAVSFQLS